MSWLTWTPLQWDGWTGLTAPVLAWLALSGFAVARLLPQARRAWGIYLGVRRERTNGGTVAWAALEHAIALSSALLVSSLCLAASLLAGHREPRGVVALVLLPIPLVKLAQAEIGGRVHARLLRAIAARKH